MWTRRSWLGVIGFAFVASCIFPLLCQAGEAGPVTQDTLSAVIKRGELIVACQDYYPPWGYRDAQNNNVGMDIDIAKELANELKVKLTLMPVPSAPDKINFLLSGKVDVAIANMTATLARWGVIDFTNPYVIDGQGVIYRKGLNIKSWSDLNGKRVAVSTGSTGEILAKQEAPKALFQNFDQASTALLSVQQGKADAYVQDYTYTIYHTNRDPKTLAYLNKPLAYAPYSFGVRKFDQEWLNYLNFFIYRLHQTGKMKELYKKHFGEEPKIYPTW